MTHRLNGKDIHSGNRADLNATSTGYESNTGIDFRACVEPNAYRRHERLQGCFDPREPGVGNIALDQQFYRQRVLPRLQISLENDSAASTISGAEGYVGASFLDGSARRPACKGNLQIGHHVRGFYEQRPLPPAFYTGADIEVNNLDVIPAWPLQFSNRRNSGITGTNYDGSGLLPSPLYNSGDCGLENTNNALRPFKFHSKPHHSTPAIHEIEPDKHRPMPADHANDDCQQSMKPSDNAVTVPVPKVPDAQLTISGAPTITPEKINEVLKEYNSPAAGMGQYIYDQGVKHGINPAMALAFYVVESKCGTSGLAVKNKSWGNMRGHGPHGYRPYNSIQESLDDWYRLMGDVYPHKFHANKLKSVVALYSPNSDGNNEAGYVRSVGQMVRKWNTEK